VLRPSPVGGWQIISSYAQAAWWAACRARGQVHRLCQAAPRGRLSSSSTVGSSTCRHHPAHTNTHTRRHTPTSMHAWKHPLSSSLAGSEIVNLCLSCVFSSGVDLAKQAKQVPVLRISMTIHICITNKYQPARACMVSDPTWPSAQVLPSRGKC
jgi:hypothetical protein